MLRLAMVLTGATLLAAGGASAQDYPTKMIRIITTSPGGFADVTSRLVAAGLSERVGQTVIVDNRAGATTALDAAVRANSDGYTMLLYGSAVWLAPFMYPDLKYDPLKELTPITLTTRIPFVLVVHPSVPAKSVAELIALAKAKPGELNYGAGNITGAPNMAAQLFNAMAGVNIVQIPYKSTGPALTDVLAGRIQLMFSTISAMTYVKAGKLRALAVTSAEPTPLAPGLPTVAASGLTGYEVTSTSAISVPSKTPPPLVRRLNQHLVAVLSDPVMKKKFFDAGADTVPSTVEQAMAKAKSERQRLGKIVTDLGPSKD